ncbi:MAG TPA: fasciclin domain-containing protein, partial [Anseongella sp.]
MKKRRHWLALCSWLLLAVVVASCSKKFDEHYYPSAQLDDNIIGVLEKDGRFSAFVRMIDTLGLRETLGEAAIYTCLAPTDEHVQAFVQKAGYQSLNEVPKEQLEKFVNYHFINGMYYAYDLEKRYLNANSELDQTRATIFKTRASDKIPGKNIRIFVPSFFIRQQPDYNGLFPASGESGLMVESARISETDRDIDANNGVIHVLEDPLPVLPRTDIALMNDPETSIYSHWVEKHVQYTLGEKDEYGWVDTTLYKGYSFGRNLADEDVRSTLLVPTDEAILSYFEPYMEELLFNTIDSLPKRVMNSLLRSTIISDFWFKSDLVRYDPLWRPIVGHPQSIFDVETAITGSVPASNSVIYKVNKVVESPEMHSVQGGVYMKFREYSQWYWMFENTNLEEGLTDILRYQHAPKTVLLQSDELWGTPLAQDMTPEELEYRYMQCRTGIINEDVRLEDGFRRKYYATEFGYLYYEDGKIYDYTGNSVSLVSTTPTWERSNGAIYEIDGFLTPMDKLDTALSVYSLMRQDPELSVFVNACGRAGLGAELNLTGFFSYTVLAPTNDAITAAGLHPELLSGDELKAFVNAYIIPNRYVFSDGTYEGQLPDKNGDMVQVAGEWGSFSITGASGNTVM